MMDNFNSMLLDVLKELGNIGSGNAATALSTMINKKVDMDVPRVKILEFKNVSEVLGDVEKPVVGIYFEMNGDIEGNIMFILDLNSAKNLVNMLFGRTDERNEIDEMDMSALSEVGNILSASYINSLSLLTGLNLTISVPSICIDMAGAILSVPAIQFGHTGDHAIFIETQFEEGERSINGDLFLIPEVDSFEKILKSLGVS
ncbi:chemotaxis protein, inhibitor of MCP mthylation [Gottschalkia acidurici 9a]|uniref:Chemotaxis protein, inhibitor of MCP mthylation n=1 Tax=Gottschalkia acidurici (strain ATCC 7906 / DSM 604 / BCRC 14475 / CIP 104303 / KCTC 5404 / NCIMB 10678 / 9a) TaxID=1128398 RepID=K0B0Y2_GOTA9|nr:chemotaxis protein CheC [Gottschalkia acidurici]AFS78585.1 chemotaxis protein, inhibitor of MCP mthylation [Gottschalkia acidurici 9a]